MVFAIFSTAISVAKILMGIPDQPDWKARSWYIRKYPNTPKAIEWSKMARDHQKHPLNAHLAATAPVSEGAAVPRPTTPDKERPQALLKGSPKALGWEVDEDEEEAAWCLLMADALETSVFEKTTAADVKEAMRVEAAAAAQKEYYRNYLETWDEQRTKLVWKVNVSLNGNHAWTLVPRDRAPSPALNETTFDSTGAISVVPVADVSSASSMSKGRERSFSDAGVQAPVDGDTPIGAQEPLSDIPPLLEVGLDMSRPPTPSSIASKGSRIPRMTNLRRDSVASLIDAALKQAPLSQSPQPIFERPAPTAVASAPAVPTRAIERKPSIPVVGAPPSSLAKRSSSPAPSVRSMRSVANRLLHRRQSNHSMKTEGSQPSKLAMSPSQQSSSLPNPHGHSHHHNHSHDSPPKLKKRASERVKSAMKAMGGTYEAATLFTGFM